MMKNRQIEYSITLIAVILVLALFAGCESPADTPDMKSYMVIFFANAQEGTVTGLPDEISALRGAAITAPDDPVRTDGYGFAGWFTEPSGGAEITFPFTLEEDTAIYAQWTAWPVVTFSGRGAPIVVPVAAGAPVTRPADPLPEKLTAEEMKTRAGGQAGLYSLSAVFLGWFDADGAVWDFATSVTDDITLTAKWADHRQPLQGNDAAFIAAVLSHVNDTNEAFLLLLDRSITNFSGVNQPWNRNLYNADLTILAAGEGEVSLELSASGGYLFVLFDAHLCIGNHITLKGISGNYRPLVYLDSSEAESIDDVKTKFVMLPGSKLTGNQNGWETWGHAAAIDVMQGIVIMNGAEISGNDFVPRVDENVSLGWQSAGIATNTAEDRFFKVVIEGNSIIKNNILGNDITGKSDHAIRTGRNKGRGALTISGSAEVGICEVINDSGGWRGITSVELAGPWTGEIHLRNFTMDNSLVYGANNVNGAVHYQLTPADLSHIKLPDGYLWNLKLNNSASILVDD